MYRELDITKERFVRYEGMVRDPRLPKVANTCRGKITRKLSRTSATLSAIALMFISIPNEWDVEARGYSNWEHSKQYSIMKLTIQQRNVFNSYTYVGSRHCLSAASNPPFTNQGSDLASASHITER